MCAARGLSWKMRYGWPRASTWHSLTTPALPRGMGLDVPAAAQRLAGAVRAVARRCLPASARPGLNAAAAATRHAFAATDGHRVYLVPVFRAARDTAEAAALAGDSDLATELRETMLSHLQPRTGPVDHAECLGLTLAALDVTGCLTAAGVAQLVEQAWAMRDNLDEVWTPDVPARLAVHFATCRGTPLVLAADTAVEASPSRP